VAVPLASNAVTVHGIDASEATIKRLQAKPGGASISVTVGDFANMSLVGTRLIYAVFNTFFTLTSQDEQVRCFANCASHLDADGSFLIEALYPDLTRFTRGQNVSSVHVDTDCVSLDVSRHDPVQQIVIAHITTSGLKMYPVQLRNAGRASWTS
jgi:hypothetical protein